jgi:hypothetical protein
LPAFGVIESPPIRRVAITPSPHFHDREWSNEGRADRLGELAIKGGDADAKPFCRLFFAATYLGQDLMQVVELLIANERLERDKLIVAPGQCWRVGVR